MNRRMPALHTSALDASYPSVRSLQRGVKFAVLVPLVLPEPGGGAVPQNCGLPSRSLQLWARAVHMCGRVWRRGLLRMDRGRHGSGSLRRGSAHHNRLADTSAMRYRHSVSTVAAPAVHVRTQQARRWSASAPRNVRGRFWSQRPSRQAATRLVRCSGTCGRT